MATLADLKAQIADDLGRDDLTSQIADAVRDAVRTYENERFWFDEQYRASATLSASAFSIAMTALPYTFLSIDRLRLRLSGGTDSELQRRNYADLMASQDARLYAQPAWWCVYNNAIQFDTAPTANTTIILDGVVRQTTASANTDTSVWFDDPTVSQLIRNAAKFSLYANIIKDGDQAAASKSMAELALRSIRDKTSRRLTTGHVMPSYF